MIGIDGSMIAAVLIFLAVALLLNLVLLRPLGAIMAERAARTTGLVEASRRNLDHSAELFSRYQAAIRNARSEGYRVMEQKRAAALEHRAGALSKARAEAGTMIEDARAIIAQQVADSKSRLNRDVEEIARGIAASVLGRPA
jgi:F-type H+-transporting ATPase subunit b